MLANVYVFTCYGNFTFVDIIVMTTTCCYYDTQQSHVYDDVIIQCSLNFCCSKALWS